jgi:glycerophosphoryl diester phosphodiesterase
MLPVYLLCLMNLLKFTQQVDLNNKVMAHRGFYGYYPEHSIRSFELAYFLNADFLETDVNITKDGKLIIFHDAYLDNVINTRDYPQYDDRRRDDMVDGLLVENKLFISDFTLEELKQFYLQQRYPYRPQIYNKHYKIIELHELIEFVLSQNSLQNKNTGIYIEPKSLNYYERRGVDLNGLIYGVLRNYELTDMNSHSYKKCPIVIQSFEPETLKYFKSNVNLPLIALLRWREFHNIVELAKYSDGLGPDAEFVLFERIDDHLVVNGTKYDNEDEFKENVLKTRLAESIEDMERRLMPAVSNKFIDYAHSLGLIVHVWDINNDRPRFNYDPAIEYAKLKNLGVNGFFSDFCDTALFAMKHSDSLLLKYHTKPIIYVE